MPNNDSLSFAFGGDSAWQQPAAGAKAPAATWGEAFKEPAQDTWGSLDFNLGAERKKKAVEDAWGTAGGSGGLTFALGHGQDAARAVADAWKEPAAAPAPARREPPAACQALRFDGGEVSAEGSSASHSPLNAADAFRSPLEHKGVGWGASVEQLQASRPVDAFNVHQQTELRGLQAMLLQQSQHQHQNAAQERPARPQQEAQDEVRPELVRQLYQELQRRRQCYAVLQAQQKALLQQLAQAQADGPSPASMQVLQQLQQLTLQMQQLQQQQALIEAKLQQVAAARQRRQQQQQQLRALQEQGGMNGLIQQLQVHAQEQQQAQELPRAQNDSPVVFDAQTLEWEQQGRAAPQQQQPQQNGSQLLNQLQQLLQNRPQEAAPAAPQNPPPQDPAHKAPQGMPASVLEGITFSGLAKNAPKDAPAAAEYPAAVEPVAAAAEPQVIEWGKPAPSRRSGECIEWGKPAAPAVDKEVIEWGKPATPAEAPAPARGVEFDMALAFEEMKGEVDAPEAQEKPSERKVRPRHVYSEDRLLDICQKMSTTVGSASLPSGILVVHAQKPELLSCPGRVSSKRSSDDDANDSREEATSSDDGSGSKKPLQPLGLNGSSPREACRFGTRCKKQNCTYAHAEEKKASYESPFGQFVAANKVAATHDVPPPSEKTVAQKIDELISKDASERARDFEMRTGAADKTVYIVGIDSATSDENVLIRLSQFGSIRKYQLCGDSSQPTRYGFFEYNTVFGAKGCMSIDGKKMFNRPVRVSRAKDAIKGGRSIPDGHQTELLRKAAMCVAQKIESLASLGKRGEPAMTRRRARSPVAAASTLTVPARSEGADGAGKVGKVPGASVPAGADGRWFSVSGASADESVGPRNSSSPNSEVIEGGMSQSNSTGSLAEHALTPVSSPNSEQKQGTSTSLWAKRDTNKVAA